MPQNLAKNDLKNLVLQIAFKNTHFCMAHFKNPSLHLVLLQVEAAATVEEATTAEE